MLSTEELTVKYGGKSVLTGVTFALRPGEIIALIGPNGAGKTTLVRSLNGAVRPASGKVLLESRPITEYSRRDIAKRIAVVAQENETKFPVSVRDFVLAGRFASGSAFGWESSDDESAADAAIEECELRGYEGRMMNELSGGERQRVVMARAVATGAHILLLDEPTANLDLAHQASMFRLVREKCRSGGYSSIVITHDINLASEFADRVMMLSRGRIHSIGTPEEVLQETSLREVFDVNVMLDRNPASGSVRVTTIY